MSNADAKAAEHFSKILHKKLENGESTSENDFDNFLSAIAYCIIDKTPLGPEAENFAAYLHAKYCYENANNSPGFDLGAVYGSLKLSNKFQKVKESNNEYRNVVLSYNKIYL